jgi:hypothetical protein
MPDIAPSAFGPDWLDAKWFGASGDGRDDDTAAIQAALDHGYPVVYLPDRGNYVISSPLRIPSGVRLTGSHGSKQYGSGATLRLSPSFSGDAALYLPPGTYEQRLDRFNIDGGAAPAGSVHGVLLDSSTANVSFAALEQLFITGTGIKDGVNAVSGTSGLPLELHLTDVTVFGAGNNGFSLYSATDMFAVNCHAENCRSVGWNLSALANSQLVNCRAALNNSVGFYLTGDWGTGTGSGGCVLSGSCTDRNASHGVLVDATGNTPILFNGLMTRRDGSSSTSAGYAGLAVNGPTTPIVVNGFTCYPGVDDNGTGNAGPQYGINVIAVPTYLAVTNAFAHGIRAGVNGIIPSWRALATRTGPTSSPSAVTMVADSA